jgi:hypothetical protein
MIVEGLPTHIVCDLDTPVLFPCGREDLYECSGEVQEPCGKFTIRTVRENPTLRGVDVHTSSVSAPMLRTPIVEGQKELSLTAGDLGKARLSGV